MFKEFAALVSTVLVTGSFAFAADGTATAPAFTEADAIAASKNYDMMCNEWATPTATHFVHKFKYSYSGSTEQEQSYFIVTCSAGAYNESSMLFREDPYEHKLEAVSFAEPVKNEKGKLAGFTASVVVGYLDYDAKTGELTSFSKGRGIGDMYVQGVYKLFEREVVLREYTIDDVEGMENEVPPFVKYTEPLNR